MPKFLLIYRDSTESRAKPSPEEMQALQKAWYAWMQKYSSAIVGGDGLKPTGRVVKGGLVTDGPYAEAKEIIASFSIIQADDYDAALAIVRECPGDDERWPSCPARPLEIREMAGYA
jgi:hypothetical protein